MTFISYLKTKQTKKILITPEIATTILEHYNDNNRKIRLATVRKYLSDMKNGCWFENGQSQWIGFYEDGKLADGQHRLMAIKDAGISMFFNVEFGISKAAAFAIDNHAPRRMEDQIKIEGEHRWIDKSIIAICRLSIEALNSGSSRGITTSEVVEFANRHRWDLIDASNLTAKNTKSLCSAYIKTAVFFALSHEDSSKIVHFSNVLLSGIPESELDHMILKLRDKILMSPQFCSGSGGRLIGLKLVMKIIKEYCKGNHLKKIYIPEDYAYSTINPSNNRNGNYELKSSIRSYDLS